MRMFPLGLREVVPNSITHEKARDTFVVYTGGTQSTLQEIKLPDGAGGFSFAHFDSSNMEMDDDPTETIDVTRNRFIIWRTTHDTLELSEHSLDWTLVGSRVKYRFQDTPILSDGLSIFETFNAVIILVPTVSSVHKMIFPHPRRMHKQHQHLEQKQQLASIFMEASPAHAKEFCHVIQSTGTTPMPSVSASWLTHTEEAVFALANSVGHINIVKLGTLKGLVSVNQLRSGSYLGRLWDHLGGMLMSKGAESAAEAASSMIIHPVNNDLFVFAVCKDHRLRVWSTSTFDCILADEVIPSTTRDMTAVQQGSQHHQLRKILDPASKRLSLALFLCLAERSQFCILRPEVMDGQIQLEQEVTLFAPRHDLIDYQVSLGRLWALFTDQDGEPVLRYNSLTPSTLDFSPEWNSVILEQTLDPGFSPGQLIHDPRQVYLKQLFHPGRFSIQTLAKTVSIYRRSSVLTQVAEEQLTLSRMRDEVCAAVENEIQNQVTEYEVDDEEYVNIAHQAWARFYSCAIQYQQAGLRPVGLACDFTGSGLISIIKKSGLSFVRPMDNFELLYLTIEDRNHWNLGADLFYDTPMLSEDALLAQDVVQLMRAIVVIDSAISSDMAADFAHALSSLVTPDAAAKKIVRAIVMRPQGLDDDESAEEAGLNLMQELATRLQQVNDVAKAMEALLMSMELDRGIVSLAGDFDSSRLEGGESADKLFASPLGISIVAESMAQLVMTRFCMARDLLVLQLLMLEGITGERASIRTTEQVHSTFLPRSVVMAHSYFVLVWLTEVTASPPAAASLEQSLRQMAVLRISNDGSSASVAQLTRSSWRPLTLSELFLHGVGGTRARALLTSDTDTASAWLSALMPIVNICAQLVWPRCTVPAFQEFLLTACQHVQIQEYVRLLSTWCDWNYHSRQFLLGSALLNMCEPEKAMDSMMKAAAGIVKDRFLSYQLFNNQEVEANEMTVLYFLKVVQLFEQFGYNDYAIEIAKSALDVCDVDDPNRTTLCYILFTHHLKLGHYDEAYDAMIMNPDVSRRKDSLRQFVVTLFERRQIRQLARYPYTNLNEDLERIIEARARSVDLTVNNYYNFLYSFHTLKENFRKAAQVMYECGLRLGVEVFTLDGLTRQAKCYLACINSLRLLDSNFAWLEKPNLLNLNARDDPDSDEFVAASPKRTFDDQEVPRQREDFRHARAKRQILRVEDIEMELELVCARLKLARRSPTTPGMVGPTLSAGETVALLVAANLFEDAVAICRLFQLDFHPVLEGLASRCVRLSRAKFSSERDSAWDWLAENHVAVAESPVESAWKLLSDLLDRLEERGQSRLFRAVSTRLFSQGASLPAWLTEKYKKLNAPELLRLYLDQGLLVEATALSLELISAVLGSGKEYFGLATSLNASAPQVWLPYNSLDQLMAELEDHREELLYRKLYDDLGSKLETYFQTVKRVSDDMLILRQN